MQRVLEYFDIEVVDASKTLQGLLNNLDYSGIKYTVLPYSIDATNIIGFLLFNFTTSWHVGIIENGVYRDSYNHFEYGNPTYILALGLLPSKT